MTDPKEHWASSKRPGVWIVGIVFFYFTITMILMTVKFFFPDLVDFLTLRFLTFMTSFVALFMLAVIMCFVALSD